jgi:branched-chain amino acid aminotransferase
MAAMRIVRMEIPMEFHNGIFRIANPGRGKPKMSCFCTRANHRISEMPDFIYLQDRNVSFLIRVGKAWKIKHMNFEVKAYEVDLYKDFYVTAQCFPRSKQRIGMSILPAVFSQMKTGSTIACF